jgi:ribosomal-protein-alanine N-acetyltransferase
MNDQYFFTSERLGFRNFMDSDLIPFHKMNSDPEVMKYFPSVLVKEQTRSLMDRINNHITEHGFGFFAVDLLSENIFIGFIGLKRTNFIADFTPCVEIGWRLDKNYWNQGLASEGATRCLEFAFSDLNLYEIYSFTPLLNKASERVMQKIGLKKTGEFNHPLIEDKHPLKAHYLYRIAK